MQKEILIKSTLTVILTTVIIAGSTYAYGAYNKANDPLEVTGYFYQEWLSYQDNPLSDKLYYNNPALSAEMEDKIDRIVSGFDKGGYDPVLLAQDKPDSIEMEITRRSDRSAVVTVTEIFSSTRKELKVDLIKEGWKWQISDIRDPEIEKPLAIDSELQNKVGDYIRNNIVDLSKEKAVLGGTFRVTEIKFQAGNKALVKYEDGHVAFSALAAYELLPDESVRIDDFKIIQEY
jgi:hypothetical protein